MLKRIKIWLLNWVISYLWNGITEQDVLQIRGRTLYIGDKPIGAARQMEIASGCKALRTIPAFHVVMHEMKMAANRRIYSRSQTQDDIIFGKACLWTIDVLEKKLYNLSNLETQVLNREEHEG